MSLPRVSCVRFSVSPLAPSVRRIGPGQVPQALARARLGLHLPAPGTCRSAPRHLATLNSAVTVTTAVTVVSVRGFAVEPSLQRLKDIAAVSTAPPRCRAPGAHRLRRGAAMAPWTPAAVGERVAVDLELRRQRHLRVHRRRGSGGLVVLTRSRPESSAGSGSQQQAIAATADVLPPAATYWVAVPVSEPFRPGPKTHRVADRRTRLGRRLGGLLQARRHRWRRVRCRTHTYARRSPTYVLPVSVVAVSQAIKGPPSSWT